MDSIDNAIENFESKGFEKSETKIENLLSFYKRFSQQNDEDSPIKFNIEGQYDTEKGEYHLHIFSATLSPEAKKVQDNIRASNVGDVITHLQEYMRYITLATEALNKAFEPVMHNEKRRINFPDDKDMGKIVPGSIEFHPQVPTSGTDFQDTYKRFVSNAGKLGYNIN